MQHATEMASKSFQKELLHLKESLAQEQASRSYYEDENSLLKEKIREIESNLIESTKSKIYAEELVKKIDDDLKQRENELDGLKNNNQLYKNDLTGYND